jgi:hypothetical protein
MLELRQRQLHPITRTIASRGSDYNPTLYLQLTDKSAHYGPEDMDISRQPIRVGAPRSSTMLSNMNASFVPSTDIRSPALYFLVPLSKSKRSERIDSSHTPTTNLYCGIWASSKNTRSRQ